MIEVVGLTKRYKNFTAVKEISFRVNAGETLGLIGTSGCGKTTTLKMMNRLIEPSAGDIYIRGEDVRRRKPHQLRQGIGYVIQNIGLFPHYTVAENIAVVPHLLKWKDKRIRTRISELLNLVGLQPEVFAHRYPHQLSGGQRQRVGFARALAVDPPIILLDEPFGALDQITRAQIQQEFKQLESLIQKTMVLVTHDVFEAVELCDSICVMDQGIVQQKGTPKELIFYPENDFVREFFQSNRFQLELSVITLQDLIPFIATNSATEGQPVKLYPSDSSLLYVLEDVAESSSEHALIGIEQPDQPPVMTKSNELLTSFYRFKDALVDPSAPSA